MRSGTNREGAPSFPSVSWWRSGTAGRRYCRRCARSRREPAARTSATMCFDAKPIGRISNAIPCPQSRIVAAETHRHPTLLDRVVQGTREPVDPVLRARGKKGCSAFDLLGEPQVAAGCLDLDEPVGGDPDRLVADAFPTHVRSPESVTAATVAIPSLLDVAVDSTLGRRLGGAGGEAVKIAERDRDQLNPEAGAASLRRSGRAGCAHRCR